MMYAFVKNSTDDKYVGSRWPLPGVATPADITTDLVTAITGGRFHPTEIILLGNGDVRIRNSNYFVTCGIEEM